MYAWEHLPQGSLVVDVGGGVGAQSFTLSKHHPLLRFVVQDRESVVCDAIEVCATNQITHRYMDCIPVSTVLEEKHARGT